MAIEYFCKGCGHCRIDNGEDIDDGLCPHCQQRRDFPEKPSGCSRVEIWGFTAIGCVAAAWLNASPNSPGVSFGIAVGAAWALFVHYLAGRK